MDLKTLKLELLERIALIDDEARLKALKRLLDSPRGYGVPNEKMSVVKEGEEPYLPIGQETFSLQEVRSIVEAVRDEYDELDLELSPEALAELDKRREEMISGKAKGLSWAEVQQLLDADRKADHA